MSVTFDYSAWVARYPEFSSVLESTAAMYFSEATLYCDNSGQSRVTDESVRSVLLNMLTAHIAFIAARDAGVVGRISSASEGSVSASFSGPTPGTGEWFLQSKYGAAFWQATAQYRKARMYAGQNRVLDPWARFLRI